MEGKEMHTLNEIPVKECFMYFRWKNLETFYYYFNESEFSSTQQKENAVAVFFSNKPGTAGPVEKGHEIFSLFPWV